MRRGNRRANRPGPGPRPAASTGTGGRAPCTAAVRQAAALLLGYPDDGWPARLAVVRDALGRLTGPGTADLRHFCGTVHGIPVLDLAARYVDTFDRSRRRTLHLTYYTAGDTRQRGAALAAVKARYREHGWQPPDDELPDHLPLVLEFAARCPGPGGRLLQDHRPGLELLRMALADRASPYADVLTAVCATLPGPSPSDRAAAHSLARVGPPTETVGLAPFGTRPPATGTREAAATHPERIGGPRAVVSRAEATGGPTR